MSTSVQGEIMDLDLDLNQEPSSGSDSPPPGLITEISPWLNELETAHERIEERLRQLEAIVSRIRERETTVPTTTAPSPAPPHRDSTAGVIHERSRERLIENGDNKTYLIAKALNMERTSSVPGGYFDCNICLEKAEDPILTCCGHLFCWGCFYQLPFIYLNIKECPVCDGEVTDSEVIPIYGNGDDSDGGTNSKAKREDCGIRLPPRPNAKRVESLRQKIINRGNNHFIPGPETLEHIRRTIDSIGGLQALAEGHEFGLTNIITTGGGGVGGGGNNNRVVQNQHRNLRLLSPFIPGFVVDTSEMMSPPSDDIAAGFDVDSFVDTPSLRRTNRRRSSRIAEIGSSRNNGVGTGTGTAGSSSSPRDFAVPGFGFSVDSNEVVTTSASSSRRRSEDVNDGPRTRSRRRLS